jgi:Asp/Glu/hydantoin racemase
VGYVRKALAVACLAVVVVGILAVSQTSLNTPLRTFVTPNGPVYLVDNTTGKLQTMIVFSFSAAVTLTPADIIVLGGGQVSAITPWGNGLLVAVTVDIVPGGTLQLSLVGANAKKTVKTTWFSPTP